VQNCSDRLFLAPSNLTTMQMSLESDLEATYKSDNEAFESRAADDVFVLTDLGLCLLPVLTVGFSLSF
jgi:hypothetical protein